MDRKSFIQNTALAGAGVLVGAQAAKASPAHSFNNNFPTVRVPEAERNFKSPAIERAIAEFQRNVPNKELGWLFNNCFPNTLDTTVDFEMNNGQPDTYVITGDIDAMWLRDSTAQVWPYLQFMKQDPNLQKLIQGVINRQTDSILYDPYANAFYKDKNKVSKWEEDHTEMKPGIHERKWEIDSLCYPVRLAYAYWKQTGDAKIFGDKWRESANLIIKTFKEQQRKEGDGPYSFMRTTNWATDGVPLSGYGYPVKPVGLIVSIFRPSDDATIFPFLIPSNFFAVVSLRQMAEMATSIYKDADLAREATALANEVDAAIKKYAITTHPDFGRLYSYEVNGFGSHVLMDDANIPSLLSLPYLGAVKVSDPLYQSTRRFVLSTENPFFWKGTAAEGIGGPHAGMFMIWHMAIIMRALTSTDPQEIRSSIKMLQNTHAGTGFLHEGFHKDDPAKFTRSWFAWTNTLFGELLWKTYKTNPKLLV